MKIHLLRSSEVDENLFEKVLEIVERFSGSLEFIPSVSDIKFTEDKIKRKKFKKDQFERQDEIAVYKRSAIFIDNEMAQWPPEYPAQVESIDWETIFSKINQYRSEKNIDQDEALLLLTDFANDKNWFSAWDPSGAKNAFVHTAQWEFFLPCDQRFPISYQVMVTLLQGMLFKNQAEAKKYLHKDPKGCVNDFCKDKTQITLKLRTADICTDCQRLLYEKKIDPRIIDQVLRTLDAIRSQMLFRERYKTTLQPSRLEIHGPMKRIYFTDLSDVELKLTPLERLVYLLFLEHTDGLHLSEVSDHREWIEDVYRQIGNSRTVAEFRNSIDQLLDPTENSMNEKMSKIRRKIVSLVGEDLAEHYVIDGLKNEKKKILLDRGLVKWE
jgi:hypothetical protein